MGVPDLTADWQEGDDAVHKSVDGLLSKLKQGVLHDELLLN
jgi:hypothetical protein